MDKTKIHKMWIADQGNGTYTNPILYTDYSDPDAVRVGEDYFMIASSFCNTPAVPLLHSKDLVNWKVINYIIDKLPFEYYEKPMHGCGTWAPAIRFHEGVYYAVIPFPDEGLAVCRTTDPWGKWSEPHFIRKAAGWIDPCPFWDDDGKTYMVNAFARSRIGFKSLLYMTPISPDCTEILDDGQFIYDGHATQPTIEGPKLYKRNGYYYIFAPAGGVKPGWQTVLRSKNIYGPWEEKIVLHQGNSPVNGPHQGAWVDTPDGQDWFLHFQDVGNAGRIVHLQPMHWENDWPVIGVNAVDGCGEPVLHYKKPEVGATYPIDTPEDSDFFEGESLGLQWQWNANYKKEWYDLKDGDVAGLVSLGGCYTALAVQKINGKMMLQQRTGNWTKDDEVRTDLGEWNSDVIYIRMKVEKENYCTFYVGTAEENLQPVGQMVEATPGRWVGVKDGLFAINEQGTDSGVVAADYFVYYD